MLEKFLHENTTSYRLARTIVQGLVGVFVANMDIIFGFFAIDPAVKTIIVAAVMAILSPIMAEMKKSEE